METINSASKAREPNNGASRAGILPFGSLIWPARLFCLPAPGPIHSVKTQSARLCDFDSGCAHPF